MDEEKALELPDYAVELMSFSDLERAYVTINRTDAGAVYLVSWWYGDPTVIAVINPDGTFAKSEEA